MINAILKFKNRFWLFVALLVAFTFRVYLLNAQSLWNDEGTSIALAARSLDAIITCAARDIHPPLYYFQLHYWLLVSGNSEFAARFLSVIAGTFIVALTYRIARFFFDVEVANVAAFLAAFSPFGVYYSQETRMYIWVALFATASVYAMVRMLEVGNWKLEIQSPVVSHQSSVTNSRTKRTLFWLFYILATIATLYSHYFGATVLAFENLSFAVWVALSWRQGHNVIASPKGAKQSPIADGEIASSQKTLLATLAPHASAGVTRQSTLPHSISFWVVAQIICLAAFLPWYFLTANQLATWPAISEPFDLQTLLWRVLNVFSVGFTLDASAAALIAFAFGVLFFIGWRMNRNAQTIWGVTLMIAWTLVPVLAMYAVSISRPAYNPKFLLLATPPFFILAARGLSHIHPGIFLRPRHPAPRSFLLRYFYWGVAVTAAISFIPSLQNYYYNPQYARDDYRAVLKFVDANARAGDGILLTAPGQIDVVDYYHLGTQPVFLLPLTRPLAPNGTRYEIDDIVTNQVKRLFAVFYGVEQADPQGVIETRLAQRGFKARDEWHGNVRLVIYGIPPAGAPRDPGTSIDARFGNEITLGRWQLDFRNARAGDVATLTLNWVAIAQPATRYKIFVHLLDSTGRVITQRDGEPVADRRITTTWNAGENIADNYGLFIEPGTPAGEYQVEVGMYRADNGARVEIFSRDGKFLSDHLVLGTIHVLP